MGKRRWGGGEEVELAEIRKKGLGSVVQKERPTQGRKADGLVLLHIPESTQVRVQKFLGASKGTPTECSGLKE